MLVCMTFSLLKTADVQVDKFDMGIRRAGVARILVDLGTIVSWISEKRRSEYRIQPGKRSSNS